MAKYSINDTSLIAIGDAIRNKTGEHTRPGTNILNMPESISSHTPNATGFDTHDGGFLDEIFIDVVRFPGASSIHVDFSYQLKFGNTGLDFVAFAPGEYDNKSFPSDAIRFSSAALQRDQITLQNTDVITIKFRPYGAADKLGYYAECSALDADGNFMGEYQVEVEGEVPNTLTPAQMATEIELKLYKPPAEAFSLTGKCSYKFSYNSWNWFINDFGNRITTNNITETISMFNGCDQLQEIPFDINFSQGYGADASEMFNNCVELKSIANINNLYTCMAKGMFKNCRNLRELPESVSTWGIPHSGTSGTFQDMFNYCFSLRKIPSSLLKELYDKKTSWSGVLGYNGFYYCYALDEVIGFPVSPVAYTSNVFRNTFDSCSRLKDVIFDTNEDGSPKVAPWKNQTVDLNMYVGYVNGNNSIIKNYNSGITLDKQVTDDATYQALKNDPDWFTCDMNYSRYNHDSAVRTINSLPDVSSGSGNTIKFKGANGSLTDGGAINTLTEEEIAVAAAKGWTVTLA